MTETLRDHGGGLDAAVALYGGLRSEWLDLSTGINPVPYPVGDVSAEAWRALPDRDALERLVGAARRFWAVPDAADIVAAPGASALIACMPYLTNQSGVYIPRPTYNEHLAAFRAAGSDRGGADPDAPVHVYIHPNNPDGRMWPAKVIGDRPLTIIDESFCDVAPDQSHVHRAGAPGVIVLKSFGKFWGLAGLRLGFAIGAPETLSPVAQQPGGRPISSLRDLLGPWAVAGPALEIGTRALQDDAWAAETRARLASDAARLDALLTAKDARLVGGTSLFRLYDVDDAKAWQAKLADQRIWSRIFPYSQTWLRLGIPAPDRWEQLEAAF